MITIAIISNFIIMLTIIRIAEKIYHGGSKIEHKQSVKLLHKLNRKNKVAFLDRIYFNNDSINNI